MSDLLAIVADPQWIPHDIDLVGKRVEFLRIERSTLTDPGFLADYKPARQVEVAYLPFAQVEAIDLPEGRLHFIFHTAFCRSTLLVRALNLPGLSAGLSEPAIFSALVKAGVQPGQAGAALLRPILRLLARPWSGGTAVFAKPTNHVNMLMPMVLAALPCSRAVLMTNSLSAFLSSVCGKGLLGRRWGRRLYLEMQTYAGMDFGMDPREQFTMTDLQAAGLAWFLAQRWFSLHLDGRMPGVESNRLRVLDGDRFNAERGRTLQAVLDLAGVESSQEAINSVVAGDIFARHSKLGDAFSNHAEEDARRSAEPSDDEEIGQVAQWVEMIARQAGLRVPVEHSLF